MNRKTLKALFVIVTSAGLLLQDAAKPITLIMTMLRIRNSRKKSQKNRKRLNLHMIYTRTSKMVRCMSIQTEGLQTLMGI